MLYFIMKKFLNFAEYIQYLQSIDVDAVTFGDPAVLMAAREVAPEMKLHWSTETTRYKLVYM